MLSKPILAGEVNAATRALDAIEHFQRTGVPPADIGALIKNGVAKDARNAVVAFFKRMAFDTYRAALTAQQVEMLRATCVFSSGMPIPKTALIAAGTAASVVDAVAALERLLGLGLVDELGVLDHVPSAAANPLARPLAGMLEGDLIACLADAVLPALSEVWRNSQGDIHFDARAIEVTRLALLARNPDPSLLDNAATAAGRYLENTYGARRAYSEVLLPTLTKLDYLCAKATTGLICTAYDVAERLGEVNTQNRALDKWVDTGKNSGGDGSVLLRVASRRLRVGQIQAAENAYSRAAEIFLDAGAVRSKAITLWNIVELLKLRGESGQHAKHNVLQYLVEAFETFQYLKVPQGIGIVGCELARVLSARGRIAEALVVLDATEKAYLFLNDEDGVAETRVLRSEAELGD